MDIVQGIIILNHITQKLTQNKNHTVLPKNLIYVFAYIFFNKMSTKFILESPGSKMRTEFFSFSFRNVSDVLQNSHLKNQNNMCTMVSEYIFIILEKKYL